VAALVYNGTYVLIAIAFNLLWRYATHNRRHPGALVAGGETRGRHGLRRQPPPEPTPQHGVRFVWFVDERNEEQLRQIGALVDAGQVGPIVAQVFPLAEACRAFEEGAKGHARGKFVLTVN
jgi:NADPH:quinone reductase-like Zn-dependent oxidoreductase